MQESAKQLLRSVWEEESPKLTRLVRAMGIEAGRAEDVLQDVYLTAWRKAPASTKREDLRRWLWRVTTNRCNLEHRRATRWRNVLQRLTWFGGGSNSSGSPVSTSSPVRAASQGEDRALIRRTLDKLEPRLRSILVLRYFAELDSKEIGKILELSDSTVRSHLRTARRQLAAELKRAGYRDE